MRECENENEVEEEKNGAWAAKSAEMRSREI